MKIRLYDGLPFVSATVEYRGRRMTLENTLLDTGSTGTVFAADKMSDLGLQYAPEDNVRRIRCVGGAEFVFMKQIDLLALGDAETHNINIEGRC